MIPKHFHWIWLGSPVPKQQMKWMFSWILKHPGFQCTVWQDFTDLQNQTYFDKAVNWAAKADIARYEILYRHGGVYVDTDFECYKPIDTFLESGSLLVKEPEGAVANSIIGLKAGDPFIKYCIDNLPAWIDEHAGQGTNVQSGPVFFTEMCKRFGVSSYVENTKLFFPYTIKEPPFIYPESYAAPHWEASWISDKRRFKKKCRKFIKKIFRGIKSVIKF